jgi:tetratricopeptide (TPR) repeat protein
MGTAARLFLPWAAGMALVSFIAVAGSFADWRDVPDASRGRCVNCPDTGGSGSRAPRESTYDPTHEAYRRAHNAAVDLYNQALKTNANSRAQYLRALDYIDEALRHEPGNSRALKFRRQLQASIRCYDGQEAAENGDFERAIRLFDEAETLYPESSKLWQRNRDWAYEKEYDKALSLMHGKSWSEAERHFRRIAPRYGYIAYFHLGHVLEGQGKISDAEWSYRQAIKLDPEKMAPYFNLAELLRRQDRYAEAESAYRQAMKIDPSDAETINNLGLVLEKQGRYEEARKAYQKALDADSKAQYAAQNLKSLDGKIRDAKVVPGIQKNIDALITDMDRKSAPGGPQSIYRTVNGKQVEFTIESRPLGRPGSAGDQLKGAGAAGQAATGASKLEKSADRAQLGFDSAPFPAGSLPVLGAGVGKPGPEVPDAFRKDPEILKYEGKKKGLDQKYSDMGNELKSINSKIEKGEGNKGELQVQAARVLDQMAAVKSEKDTLDVHIQERVRKLKFTGVDLTPAKKKPDEPPFPAGKTLE